MATRKTPAPSRRKKAARPRTRKAATRARSAQQRVISQDAIILMLRHLLDPHGIYPVVLKAPIENYIRGGKPALRAFFAPLNRAFRSYGLNLKPGDLANVKTVLDVVDVIDNWFRKHGYQVTS